MPHQKACPFWFSTSDLVQASQELQIMRANIPKQWLLRAACGKLSWDANSLLSHPSYHTCTFNDYYYKAIQKRTENKLTIQPHESWISLRSVPQHRCRCMIRYGRSSDSRIGTYGFAPKRWIQTFPPIYNRCEYCQKICMWITTWKCTDTKMPLIRTYLDEDGFASLNFKSISFSSKTFSIVAFHSANPAIAGVHLSEQ